MCKVLEPHDSSDWAAQGSRSACLPAVAVSPAPLAAAVVPLGHLRLSGREERPWLLEVDTSRVCLLVLAKVSMQGCITG